MKNLDALPKDSPLETIIVGSGFSGLGMAIQLKKAGRDSFVILEKAGGVGGTWRENRYPGCACDVPSHLYSFSFEPHPGWSRMFAPQEEILSYLEHCAKKYELGPHIRFHSQVERAFLDEGSGLWHVQLRGGEVLRARHLVLGIGALHRPAHPEIEGLDSFTGKAFHSAEWDNEYDLRGKRVAVIGTGASAIQFVPRIAPKVERLYLFQRTPPWVLPKPDRAMKEWERKLFGLAPLSQRLYRYWIYWLMEMRAFGFNIDPRVMRLVAALGRRHIRKQIRNPRLRELVTPSYTPGCKRILMADDYYPTLERPNVEVVTDGIAHMSERGVVTKDGVERPVDAVVYGTGFRVTELLTHMQIRGLGGIDINDAWKGGVEAYLGTTVSGFPNLYLLMGPNTGLGHNSMVFMIEAQIDYVLGCMRVMDEERARFADVKPNVQKAFNERIRSRLTRTVWASGCHSWYLDAEGRNSTTWPGFTFEFWLRTRRVNANDYELLPRL